MKSPVHGNVRLKSGDTTSGLRRLLILGAMMPVLTACEPAKTTRQPQPAPEPASADGPRYPPGGTPPGDTPKQTTELSVVFQWRLAVARTGRPARESAVGYVRSDGTPGGVILINGEGAVIQPIPGTQGPDAAAVARRWLEARGWTLR